MSSTRPATLLLVVLLFAWLAPSPAAASHCTEQGSAGVGAVSACDNNRDGAPDQVVLKLTAAPLYADVAAYRQDYANAEYLVARAVVSVGVPYAPTVHHSSRVEDNDGSGRYERSFHTGGVYTSGAGSGDVYYLIILRDANENLQVEDEDVLVCETFDTGCHVLV